MFKIISEKKYKELNDIIQKQKTAFDCEVIKNRQLEEKLIECNDDLKVLESRNKDLNKLYDKTELNLRETIKENNTLQQQYLNERESNRKLTVKLDTITSNRNTLIEKIEKYSQFNKQYLKLLVDNITNEKNFVRLIKGIDITSTKVMRYSNKTLNYEEVNKND